MNHAAEKLIADLGLAPLPREGGWFRRQDADGAESLIWFLLAEGDFSALHRLRAEEQWSFYSGDVVEHVQLDPATGRVTTTLLGVDLSAEAKRECWVPAGVWQGARLAACAQPRGWALLGCRMRPAWREEDFELGARAELERAFPVHAALVSALTR